MLLRFNGVPARVAVGFATGDVGIPRRLLGRHQQRPRLGGGLLPHRRLGGVRPHSRAEACRTPGASSTSPGFKDPFASSPSGQSTVDHRHRRLPTCPSRPRPPSPYGRASAAQLDQHRSLAALGARPARAAGRLAGRQEVVAGERSAARDSGPALRRLFAAATRRPLHVRSGGDGQQHPRGGAGPRRDPPGAEARPGAGRPGGRRPLRRTEGHGRRTSNGPRPSAGRWKARLRKRHGWFRTVLTWYGVPHAAPARARRGAAPGRAEPGAHLNTSPWRSPKASADIQLTHACDQELELQGKSGGEEAGLRPGAVQALRHLRPLLPVRRHRSQGGRHAVSGQA